MLSVLLKIGTLRVMLICVPPSVLPFLGNTSRMSVQWKIVSEVVQFRIHLSIVFLSVTISATGYLNSYMFSSFFVQLDTLCLTCSA